MQNFFALTRVLPAAALLASTALGAATPASAQAEYPRMTIVI